MTDLPDESTIRVRRGQARPLDADGVTEASTRRGVAGEGTTQPSDPDTTEPPGPRRRSATVEGADADAAPDADEGSTIVARRESRRRASRVVGSSAPAAMGVDPDAGLVVVAASGGSRGLAATSAGDVPAPLRVAEAPAPTGALYTPRTDAPAISARAQTAARAPQTPVDTAAVEHAARRRARRRLGVIVAASLGTVLAATAAILILLAL